MKALEAGRRLRFEQLHWQSVMPAHQIAQAHNNNRGENTAPASPNDYLVFKKLAFPEKEHTFSDKIVSTIQAIAKTSYPQWIRYALPWGQIMGGKPKCEPADPLLICCKQMAVIAPTYIDGWLQIELAAFNIDNTEADSVITLYDPRTNDPVIDIRLRKADVGTGYYENERFKVLKSFDTPRSKETGILLSPK
jgi:hypothetical protein